LNFLALPMARSTWLPAVLITLAGGILIYILDQYLTASVWDSFYAPESVFYYFCETTQVDRFLRQPANSYTNLGYLLVGSWMIVHGIKDLKQRRGNLVGRFPIYSILYGLGGIYTFVGSSLFHASLALEPEWMDLSAVYAWGALPVVYNLHRIRESYQGVHRAWPYVLGWMAWVILTTRYTWELKAHYVMPVVLVVTALTMVWAERRGEGKPPWKWIWVALSAAMIGITCFIFDIQRVGCVPDGVLHPHGVWHLMAGISAGGYYCYMRAEKASEV